MPPKPRRLSSSAPMDQSHHGEGKRKEDFKTIDSLFSIYRDKTSKIIEPAGIELFCSHLQVKCTDVRMLMLAWKMQAEKQAYFTKDEWRRGLQALNVDTIGKIQKALPLLEQEVHEPSNFMDFYKYAFKYCLTENMQRTIDIETTCELLNLVLASSYRCHVDKITRFLKSQNNYKVITMDQWEGFYRFCKEINYPSLDNYSDTDSWPTILDDFVEWLRENQS